VGHAAPEGGPHGNGNAVPGRFKAEAVRLYRATGRSQREIAKEVGIAPETPLRWVIRQDVDSGARAGLTTEEREERGGSVGEVCTLNMERDLLKNSRPSSPGSSRPDRVVAFRFIRAEKANFPVAFMCSRLGVSRSGD
jgi:transposase